nr:MAG TPA: head tail connector [Caudoviricetes sp.]
MRVELNEIKNYLRVDHPFDDTLLTTLKKVAEEYVYSAIELENVQDSRFDLAVLLLIGHFYSNRSATTGENISSLPLGVTSLIHQLRGLGSDT